MFELCEEHNYRRDLHYHLIAGEGRWMPRDFGHPDSVHINIVYDDKKKAHATFVALVKSFSDGSLEHADYEESFAVWSGIVADVEKEHKLELITFLGMEYYDAAFPISLIACNGCVPYGMN
jgi:hypothetical protein